MPLTDLHRTVATLLLAGTMLLPAACNRQEAQPAQEEPGAPADAPDAPAGISVAEARLILPPVTGNPGAIYFTITNGGEATLEIASVAVTDAGMAMLHTTRTEERTAMMEHVGQVPVRPGQTVTFAPGGLHVMVHDLGPGIAAGRTAEVTLTFTTGDKVSFPAAVQTLGGGA